MKTPRDFALAFPSGAICYCDPLSDKPLCKRHAQLESLIDAAMIAATARAFEQAARIAEAPFTGQPHTERSRGQMEAANRIAAAIRALPAAPAERREDGR